MSVRTLPYAVAGARREAEDALQRSHTALEAQPARHVAQRFADVAQSLSRAGVALAHAETLNAALQRMAQLCYEVDTDTRLCNVDVDGRLERPAPWGKAGHKAWGLRRREGDILRAVLLQRQAPKEGRAVPLFLYDAGARSWYLNLQDYPTHADAHAYLRKHAVTSREYKTQLERLQTADSRRRLGRD